MNKFPAELADFRRFSTFLGGISETYCSHLFTQLSISSADELAVKRIWAQWLVYDEKVHRRIIRGNLG
jgi:hypothetical protein